MHKLTILTIWMKYFIALRTLKVDPALLNLNPDILLQAHYAEQVVAVSQAGELVWAVLCQAQGALSHRTSTTHVTVAGPS